LGLKNATPYNIALSDSSGVVTMEVPKYQGAGDNFYEAKITSNSTGDFKMFEVKTSTIDEIFKQTGVAPSFIKCDVEGHEWFVFKGATEFLSKHKPLLLIEINQDLSSPDSNTTSLISFLKEKKYSIYILKDSKLVQWNGERKVNYYFLTNEHISKINA
jgi:FkbM family methyltransferase